MLTLAFGVNADRLAEVGGLDVRSGQADTGRFGHMAVPPNTLVGGPRASCSPVFRVPIEMLVSHAEDADSFTTWHRAGG